MLASPVTITRSQARNRILNSLPFNEFEKIKPDLKSVKLKHGEVIYQPNEPIKYVYFPEDCIISTVTVFDDGTSIENGIIGNEGLLGVAPALSSMTTPREATVQTTGECLRIPSDKFREAFETNSILRHLSLSYIFAFFEQVAQAGACNKHHTVYARMARWLLMLSDRIDGDELQITQDGMAQMLGVHRPGITLAAINLKDEGLINYRRGTITICDRERLEKAACECYGTIRRAYNQYVSILELQQLNEQLETANLKFAAEMERRQNIQRTTQQRVTRLRGVVSDISKWRKSQVICARCERVSEEGGEWAQVNEHTLQSVKNNHSKVVTCPPCEDNVRQKPKVETLEKRRTKKRS
ncbi:MAG TPA: Crp/Fnr family transcriptional regulator [Pyrinomonadaceae bacterium]|jgi:CRP-like cAMP-binding protein